MLCLASFIILIILGIFSARFRPLAKEAFLCVFKRLTLRPCEMEFGKKMKAKTVGFLSTRWAFGAKVLNKYAEVLAWVFVILSLASLIYTGRGVYNFLKFGTCDPQNPQNCILKDAGQPQIDCTVSPYKTHSEN